MGEDNKNCEPFKIPNRYPLREKEAVSISSREGTGQIISFEDQQFAEIEIKGYINSSSYTPAPLPQVIEPVMDEKRKIFNSMREISRYNHSSYFINSKFYSKQAQYENSKIFYKQAEYMKDFEDDYTETVPFSSYFPYYQLMSYEQLRTYFTWRTKVRSGRIENTSLSYAFIYIYELLNNIGVSGPQDGLCKLMSFWSAFKLHDATIDKYLIKWVKDYHIYYELPKSFIDFLTEYELHDYYPDIIAYDLDKHDCFERLHGISKYNIKQSSFYGDETKKLIADCFNFVIGKLKDIFTNMGIVFNDLLFQPSKSKFLWTPFSGALFFQTLRQPDRQVVLSENEVYICSQNKWLSDAIIPIESGKYLVGYIFKQMEAVLRKAAKYKYKLSANQSGVDGEIIQKLGAAGLSLEKVITDAVLEYCAEINKIVVTVNHTALNRIRLEALDTQEKLIVPENDAAPVLVPEAPSVAASRESTSLPAPADELDLLPGGWTSLKNALSETELKALANALQGGEGIKQFADQNGIMLEVLADSINEKAVDHIGDNILELDDSMIIYAEYKEKVIKMVGR